MAEAIRLVSMQRGYDPRRFALVALGGAGPVHATALADELGITNIIVPVNPGVLSAMGLLMAPIEHEVTMSLQRDLVDLSPIVVGAALENLDTRCHQLMEAEGVSTSDTEIRHLADVCYIGQSYHLEVRLHLDDTAPLDRLYRDFKIVHDRVHGHATDAPVKIVNLRSVHSIGRGEGLGVDGYGTDCPDSRKGHRSVLFANADGPRKTAIYQRERLAPAERIDGPAIIEQPDTTTIVSMEWRAIVQDSGDLIVEKTAPS
jgi:N-methylhydantoinase A/oxoprolinase/acetone carboxylase beta subunit